MKNFVSTVLLFALVPITVAQKSTHTMIAVFAHTDDEVFVGPLLAHYAHQGVKFTWSLQRRVMKVGLEYLEYLLDPNSPAFVPKKHGAPVANLGLNRL